MENTGQVLFQDDSPRWFLAVGSDSIGPLSASDLYERILLHEITWAHYVWRKGLSAWTRLCDLDEFKAAAGRWREAREEKRARMQTERAEADAAWRPPSSYDFSMRGEPKYASLEVLGIRKASSFFRVWVGGC